LKENDMTKAVIVHYYDSTASRIVRSREYASLRLARAAMARAAKRHQIAGIAGERTATARIEAMASECGRQVVTMRASLSERVDVGGALVPDAAAGVTRALPLETLHRLQTTTEPTLLFLG
jgi:hypothetical protein